MPSQKFELSDISAQRYSSDTDLTPRQEKKSGCFVSTTVGVVLAFFVVLLAVAVGLIVYFAADGRDLVCKCDASNDDPSTSAIIDRCKKLAEEGQEEICNTCSLASNHSISTPEPTDTTKVKDVRLPTALNPEHYDVWLQPYLYNGQPDTFSFKGSVKVIVTCTSPTNKVTLHINVLQVDASSIKFYGMEPDASDPSYVSYGMDADRQFIIINVNKNMMVGKMYAVEMNFTSPLKDDLKGLYYSSYTRGNKTIYLATTQFQPTDARKTFPCMDEPALKATFNITLVRAKHLISISNMPVIDTSKGWSEDGIDYVADVYQQTPKMPTYLLAFIICDFEWTKDTTINNITYRAIARPEAKESTRYALQVGVEILTYYEKYFEIPFPLPKQDMIAIPDFAAGAMENWGLITYRETAMLYTPGVSNERNKERVAVVVSHELAHQWFGDLVTPSWWDDLWLNEGFASFVEYLGVDEVHPEWKMFEGFVVGEVQDVFDFDGLISSHPVYVPVAHPDEINEIFDRISYGKGASIIRMMRHFLGYETFRKGLVRYLRSKQYDAAFHDDLWAALSEQSRLDGQALDVKSIMDTWTLQMNYPVVLVSRDFNDLNALDVTQKRYLRDRSAEDPGVYKSDFGYQWTIPLTFTSSQSPNFNDTNATIHWMYHDERQKTFPIGQSNLPPVNDKKGWILANVQQNGYYRVNYQIGNWKALADQLKTDHKVIPVINRAQIINDAWNLAKSGDLILEVALDVVEYLDNEMDYVPWSAADREFSFVRTMLSLTPAAGAFENFLANKTSKAYKAFGLDNTDSEHTETYARVLIASWTCATGNKNCIDETSRLYRQWMDEPDNNKIDPNLKSLVYCNSVKNGDWEEWKFALDMYLASSDAGEKARLLSAMSCSRKSWILNNYLYMLLEENSVIRRQDALSVINYVSDNVIGRPLAWTFFKAHYDELKAQFGSSAFAWSRVIGRVTAAFNTEYAMEEIKSFMESKAGALGTGKRAFEQAIEKTQGNIKWMEANYPTIKTWLENGGYFSDETPRPTKVKDVRLPTALNPEHYDVWLQPYMYNGQPDTFSFKGSVKVIVNCTSPTSNVTLHINVLQVNEPSIRFYSMEPDSSDPNYINYDMDTDRQFIIINVDKDMMVGKMYAVEMNFTSPLKDDLAGLYYSSYTRGDKTIYLATTQFQPTDARKTFPCMDEPALKATFNITLVRAKHLISISNMPVIDNSTEWTEDGIDFVADVYQQTPKMPTYLLAFIICDFRWTEDTTVNNVTYRAIARPEAVESTRYALQVGVDILTYYEDYFEIKFPLPKQDMIAIPDFAAGAMENWGLITYRETAMLYTPGVSNERNKERVAVVVSHELAHQWFGDLVTPSWWDDLWLNEGFASFVEYLGVDKIHPEWKMFEGFAVGEVQDVFDFDGLISSHPVYVPVAHPDEINEIFDRISYGKGASIIRMMRHFLGYETFRKGLVRYLNSKAYGAAFHDDLWQALTEQSKIDGKSHDVKSIMDTWTLQMNYPVVLVSRTFHDLDLLHVAQERYLRDRSAKDPGVYQSPFGYQWTIPLTFTSSENPDFNDSSATIYWMYHNETNTTFSIGQTNLPPVNDSNGWILANLQQNGYYRVNYQIGNWRALANQLKENHTIIPVINRAQIINDAWNLAKSGDLKLEIALEVVEYLGNEMDYVPWSAAVREFSFVRTMLSLTPEAGAFENFLSKMTSKLYNVFGLDNTDSDHTETYARVLIASWACGTGNEDCREETSRLYRQWMEQPDRNRIDPNLKSMVYCNSVRNGGWKEWNFALNRYLASSDAGEKVRLLSAMSCSRTPWILNNYLYMLLANNSVIRKQDAVYVISYVSDNIVGRPLTWKFFKANYDELREKFGYFSWSRVIGRITSAFNTEYDLEEIKSFMESKADALGNAKRGFEMAIEKTEGNIKWMATNYPIIRTWLENGGHFSDETSPTTEIKDVRLPTALNPEHYDVWLQPYMYNGQPDTFSFKGSVKVIVTCTSPTSNVTLHINVLQVDPSSIKFYGMDPNASDPTYVNYGKDTDRQFIIIYVNRDMTVGKMYVVEMNFISPLKDDLKGLYYSSYTRGNETIYLATTQFQPTDARKTFPCMDEPALKATFNITLVRAKHLISISNMPVIDNSTEWTEDGTDFVADVYQKTPKMSTYLLAFIICDFKWTENTTVNNVTYRALARPEAVQSTRYALQIGVDVLTYYEEYFKTNFPLPKQDMIAIPDFAAGAMENWGLITYRETAMLYTPGVSSERDKERVAIVVSHELAHQWFGNLVTPSWWDDLWLNEGFATFVEYLGVDKVHPEWKMFEGFAVGNIQRVFESDGLISSHPLYVPVAHPDEINEIFDSISYGKGAAIIRMMRHFLGYDTFSNGLARYLTSREYGAAFHDDLWEALTEQSTADNKTFDVKSIMDTWVLQMNFPVVTVVRDSIDPNVLKVKQERYLRDRSAKDPGIYESPFGYKWTIPLTFTSSKAPDFNDAEAMIYWMYHNETEKIFRIGESNPSPQNNQAGWIIANLQQNGFYRVNYEVENWNLLANQLKTNHSVIPVINRAQIINDAWNLAKSGYLQLEVALKVVEYLDNEMDYIPWSSAVREFSFVRTMLSLTSAAGAFENFLSNKTSKAFARFGLDNTGSEHTETYARVLIASWTCAVGNLDCGDETSRLYKKWMDEPDKNEIDPNLKSLVYCNAIKNGGQDEWKFALNMYLNSSDAGEKARLLGAMSCSRTPWILNNYLYMLLEENAVIRKQDALSVISYVSGNVIGRSLAWTFFKAHYDELKAQYGNAFFAWTSVISQVTSAFNTEYELQEIKSLMESKAGALGTGKRAFEQAIEMTQGNIKWMETNYATIKSWLENGGFN